MQITLTRRNTHSQNILVALSHFKYYANTIAVIAFLKFSVSVSTFNLRRRQKKSFESIPSTWSSVIQFYESIHYSKHDRFVEIDGLRVRVKWLKRLAFTQK